jgi:hypothetical protein
VDQAEEVERDEIAVLRGSLRLKIKREPQKYVEIYTANPRACWLRDDFITEAKEGGVFVPALPKDNPHLPPDYERTLIDAFGYRPELLAAYLHGDWTQIEDEAQVIRDVWIQRCNVAPTYLAGKIISCDVARFGDDKTEVMLLDGSQILEMRTFGFSRTTEISSYLAELSRQNGNCPIVVDEIGVGGGVVDELYKCGRRVIPFNAAHKADNESKYYNMRAQAWWEVAELFSKTELGCRRIPTELRKQLCIPRYELRNGRILIELKAKIKERLGYSPDLAEAYVMGIWGLSRANPQVIPVVAYSGVHNDSPYSKGNTLFAGLQISRKGA